MRWLAGVATVFTIRGLAAYVQVVCLSRTGNNVAASLQRRLYPRIAKIACHFSSTAALQICGCASVKPQQGRVTSFPRLWPFCAGPSDLDRAGHRHGPTLSLLFLVFGPPAIYGVRSMIARVRDIMRAERAPSARRPQISVKSSMVACSEMTSIHPSDAVFLTGAPQKRNNTHIPVHGWTAWGCRHCVRWSHARAVCCPT